MKLSEVMAHDVILVRPHQTIRHAAEIMAEEDVGIGTPLQPPRRRTQHRALRVFSGRRRRGVAIHAHRNRPGCGRQRPGLNARARGTRRCPRTQARRHPGVLVRHRIHPQAFGIPGPCTRGFGVSCLRQHVPCRTQGGPDAGEIARLIAHRSNHWISAASLRCASSRGTPHGSIHAIGEDTVAWPQTSR